ncbi:MAG: hypothetical protein DI535_20735 [Citrobacter freundii]|nr:MAG: hypothetical protein DI535_20735 [Citrobacter freundii]
MTDIGFLTGGCQQGFLRIWIGFRGLDSSGFFLDLDQVFQDLNDWFFLDLDSVFQLVCWIQTVFYKVWIGWFFRLDPYWFFRIWSCGFPGLDLLVSLDIGGLIFAINQLLIQT